MRIPIIAASLVGFMLCFKVYADCKRIAQQNATTFPARTQLRAYEDAELSRFGWEDQATGKVRIPINESTDDHSQIEAPNPLLDQESYTLWDLSLVDPDNRRPVDYALRLNLLDQIERKLSRGADPFAREITASWRDGRIIGCGRYIQLDHSGRLDRSIYVLDGFLDALGSSTSLGLPRLFVFGTNWSTTF